MKRIIFLILCLLSLPSGTSLASEPNAGFVQGLWYSSEPVFVGVPTRIYVAVRNNTEHDLTGTVRFMDNDTRIGSSEISALSGRLVEAWVDWTPTDGEHKISAVVTDAKLHIIGGGTESLDIAGITAEDSLSVDSDTDKDGIGNATDTDDDNDGILDADEKTRGSNPLVANPKPQDQAPVPETVIKKAEERTVPEEVSDTVGLEEYTTDGVADTLLGNATAKIETARESLDTYREKRNEEQEAKNKKGDIVAPTETPLGTYTNTATITRTQIEPKNSLLNTFVESVANLLSLIWTFILFLASQALGHPALIELILLLGIVYMTYRIARRLGSRPKY